MIATPSAANRFVSGLRTLARRPHPRSPRPPCASSPRAVITVRAVDPGPTIVHECTVVPMIGRRPNNGVPGTRLPRARRQATLIHWKKHHSKSCGNGELGSHSYPSGADPVTEPMGIGPSARTDMMEERSP
jgi:hypothetical protein